jgi:hypothetical protein
MVTHGPEQRAYPCYSLDRIRELATDGCVRYAGTRVSIDVDNLGLLLDDVCACLASLDASCFHGSERYVEEGPWHDIYRCTWGPVGRRPDNLYIKLRLGRTCLIIDLCSFHMDR